ncbi:hypothetical protein ACTL6P_08855 [Endozoicomonas acroporae]|uniref:hypothetical protein n=1 Tax=Endozoicomonas acroporae TaxID=1701104 RepID=UPI000C75F303|nr:hypothetical protein [Endozoicomonas acroporae]
MINRKPKELAPTLLVDGLIFLSAYFPLFAILLIQDFQPKAVIPEHNVQALLLKQFPVFMLDSGLYLHAIAIVLFGLSALATLCIAGKMRTWLNWQEGGKAVTVSSCAQIHGDMLNYTLPFLIGLFAFNYQSWQSITSLLVFLLFMFAFVRRDRVTLLNPIFLLLGIRLYLVQYREIGTEHSYEKRMLCWGELTRSDERLFLKEVVGIHFIYPDYKRKENSHHDDRYDSAD